MNLNQLRAFREVMLTGSVSEAARNLRRTQPAISAQIAALEDNLGCKLFLRQGGRLKPAPEANYLLEEANDILGRLNAAERILRNVRDLEHGKLQIACMPGPSTFLLPELVGQFVEKRDGVKVALISRASSEVLQLVSSQQYDIGLIDLDAGNLKTSRLIRSEEFRMECFCAVAADDPLAEKTVIAASDLDGKPMAALYASHKTSQRTQTAFELVGAKFEVRFEAQFFMPLLTYIEKGLSYAVVSAMCAETYRLARGWQERIVFRPFEPSIHMEFAVITPAHRPPSALAKAFTELLMAELARLGAVPLKQDAKSNSKPERILSSATG